MGARRANYEFPTPCQFRGGKKEFKAKRKKINKQSTKPNPASLSSSHFCLFRELTRGSFLLLSQPLQPGVGTTFPPVPLELGSQAPP